MLVRHERRKPPDPLIEGYIGVVVALEHLQKHNVVILQIFDLVSRDRRHEAYIVRIKVHRSRFGRRVKNRSSSTLAVMAFMRKV